MTRLRVLAGIGYPFLALAALSLFQARMVALILGSALAYRLCTHRRRSDLRHLRGLLPFALTVTSILAIAAILDDRRLFLLVPSLVNLALLAGFARTLIHGPSMVEILARLQGYNISPDKVGYCRTVTLVWCGFFAINSAVILWLALHASLAWWATYTGIIAYVLIGALLGAEMIYRAWRFRDYRDGVADRILRIVFPPRVNH